MINFSASTVRDIASIAANKVKAAAAPVTGAVDSVVNNDAHLEGPVARAIEEQTAKLPSDLFLWAGLGSIVLSAALQVAGKKQVSTFVGQWVPTFLLLGIYNKIVKVQGSDKRS